MVFRHWTAGARDSAPKRKRRKEGIREGRAVTACCLEFLGYWNSPRGKAWQKLLVSLEWGEELAVPQACSLQGLQGEHQRGELQRERQIPRKAEESQSLGQRHKHWGSHRPGQDIFPAVSHWVGYTDERSSPSTGCTGPAKKCFRANCTGSNCFHII